MKPLRNSGCKLKFYNHNVTCPLTKVTEQNTAMIFSHHTGKKLFYIGESVVAWHDTLIISLE